MKKYFLFSLLVVAALTLSACGETTSPVTKNSTTTGEEGKTTAQPTSQLGNENIDKNKLKQELSGISDASETSTKNSEETNNTMITVDPSKFEDLTAKYSQAVFNTNQGSFTIKFFGDKAPQTVNNFLNLTKIGYYDGIKFHRVIANFMIQGGDQNTKDDSLMSRWGTGGPGYTIKDEFGAGLSNAVGTISMANAGPNTGGSQFFINVADNSYLDGKHAVFGEVADGMDVVNKISKLSVDSSDRPTEPVIVENIVLK